MISSLSIRNFKSIDFAEFKLANLNLLAGTNSSGKSSVIQALLLASDNATDESGSVRNMVSMHIPAISFNESRNYITNAKQYDIDVAVSADKSMNFKFRPKDDEFIGTVVEQSGEPDPESLKHIFHLSAMRSGDLNAPKINPDPDSNPIGMNGEYLTDYYYSHRKDILPPSLLFYKHITTLEGQVNFWLMQLTGYTLEVEPLGSEYKVRFITPEGKSLHPYNVGTGVNFLAETLIVSLASKIGSIVIVENPEIHIHPAAQAALLDFFVQVANAGIQVIIESHSDHIFNGIRRSLKQQAIKKEMVSVYNFIKKNGLTKAQEVSLSSYGGIENYVPGMFDQFDVDLDVILS